VIFLIAAIVVTAGVVAFTLFVRPGDLPLEAAASPVHHLEDRRAAIYENLRDLNFEYRLGKLSDADYQKTKLSLQKELAVVLAEMDRILKGQPAPPQPAPQKPVQPVRKTDPRQCPHCGAKFDKPMKFCGECGKPIAGPVA
jgi:hypothetical protein